jgi:hypothetical protein
MLNTEQAERLAEYWQRRADETEECAASGTYSLVESVRENLSAEGAAEF